MPMIFFNSCRTILRRPQPKEPPPDRMHEIAPARQSPLTDNLETESTEQTAPVGFASEGALSGASAPLLIVTPADASVPPRLGNVFIDHREAAIAKYAAHFIQHEGNILGVMQYVTEQHRVE